MRLFTNVTAEPIAAGIWEVLDCGTRYFVTRDAIDDCDGKYADDAEGEGYSAWCRNTVVVTGCGQYGIADLGMTPTLFAAIALALESDPDHVSDPRWAYAVAHSV